MKQLTISAALFFVFLIFHYLLAPMQAGVVQQASLDAAQNPAFSALLSTALTTKSFLFVGEAIALIAFGLYTAFAIYKVIDKVTIVPSLAVLLLLVPLLAVGCMGTAKAMNVQSNEIAFVVMLAPASEDVDQQTIINGSEEYWNGKQQAVGTSVVRVEQYWFSFNDRPGNGEWRDDRRVITVSTTAITMRWSAPPIVEGQPLPDMSNAFSLTTIESAGVYTGAELIANIKAEDAALYLANYGIDPNPEPDGSYVARPLISVLEDEVEAFIQTQLSDRYIVRTADQVNTQAVQIFDEVSANLVAHFADKGITISEFGMRDVNVWEDAALQRRFNNTIERQEQLDEANDNATRAYIENSMTLQAAQVQATATMIAAQSEAESQRLIGEAIAENPESVQMRALEQWDGRLPVYMDSDTVLPYIPQPQPTSPAQ